MANTDPTRTIRLSIIERYQNEYEIFLTKLKDEFFTNYNTIELVPTKRQEFDLYGSIGRGHRATMLLARHRDYKQLYGVKRLLKNEIYSNNHVQSVFVQKQVLSSSKFPFLIHLEMTFKDYSSIFFVYPFFCCGDMYMHLRKQKTLKERDAMFYASQVILALEYLHNLGLIYRNLKPENVLFAANGYIKLSDFRFIKFVNNLRTYTLCGTSEYLAPEMLLMKGYGLSVDWWTVGIFIFEMIAGFTPFVAPDPMQSAEKILNCKIKFTENFTQKSRHLIRNMLQVDISKRFGNLKNGVGDIKFHEWFEIIDWQAIYNQRIMAPFIPIPIHDVRKIIETSSGYTDDPNCKLANCKDFDFF